MTTLEIKSGLGPAGSSLSNDVNASLQELLRILVKRSLQNAGA